MVAAPSASAWGQPAPPDVSLDQALPLAGTGPAVPRDLAELPPAVARAGYGYPDGRGLQDHARATPGSRFAAILVDSLAFTGGYVVVALVLGLVGMVFGRYSSFTAGLSIVFPLTLLVAVVAYQIVLNGRGQTLGKRVMKIAVVDVNTGAPIGPGRSAVRLLMMNVMGIPCYLGYLSVLGEGYRGWHDRAADSIVVKV